jgi:hypothetical protein
LNISKTGSWVEAEYWIPFRSRYLYWATEQYTGNTKFKNNKVKIKWDKRRFVHNTLPYEGFIITCWTKDKTKAEKAMDQIDKHLRKNDKEYEGFIRLWHQNVLKFLLRRSVYG